MSRLVTCFGALCVAGILGLCGFAYVGHKDSLKRVDMAVLVGHGEYGSFLTNAQKNQLDEVLTRYHQGYFFELYIAAPESLKAYSKVPFAVAEYLNAGGIGQKQLLIDDQSESLTGLAQNVHAKLEETHNPEVLVFANSLTMARVKLAFSQADLSSSGFAHTSKLAAGDIPALIGEVARYSKEFLGLVDDKPIAVASNVLDELEISDPAADLLFKPLDLVSAADSQIAWQRVVVNAQ